MLREARIRKGLSIRDVEDATKIRVKYLEALEQDDFEVIPGSTYVKAFLRTYATYLKLDADELVDDYGRSHAVRREETGGVRGEAVQYSRSRTVAERERRRTRRTQRGFALIGVLAVAAVVLLAWLGSGIGGEGAARVSEASTPSATSPNLGAGGTGTTVSANGTSTTVAPVVVTSGEDVTMVLTVTENSCWLVVNEDSGSGDQLYAGTLYSGGQMTFDGSKRYWMRVGNPGVLSVTVNGLEMAFPELTEQTTDQFYVTEAGIEPGE